MSEGICTTTATLYTAVSTAVVYSTATAVDINSRHTALLFTAVWVCVYRVIITRKKKPQQSAVSTVGGLGQDIAIYISGHVMYTAVVAPYMYDTEVVYIDYSVIMLESESGLC